MFGKMHHYLYTDSEAFCQPRNIEISEKTAATFTQSMQLLMDHRQSLSSAMKNYVADSESAAKVPMIFDMLFDHASSLTGREKMLPDPVETLRRHQAVGITSGTYSIFGDGLGAIMRDVLGLQATTAMVAEWGDTYWAIVRSITRPNVDRVA